MHRGAGVPGVVERGNRGRSEGRKRRRELEDGSGEEDLREELKRLKSELQAKDERLRKLEGMLRQLQEFV